MGIKDKSTKALKRFYVRHLRRAWRYQKEARTGVTRDLGASGWYWSSRGYSIEAKEELERRGVDMP